MTEQEKQIADLKAKITILEKSIAAIVFYLDTEKIVKDKKGQYFATGTK